jgi:hypothetical protein
MQIFEWIFNPFGVLKVLEHGLQLIFRLFGVLDANSADFRFILDSFDDIVVIFGLLSSGYVEIRLTLLFRAGPVFTSVLTIEAFLLTTF